MNGRGLVVMVLGVFVLVQVTKGNALARLGIVGGSA